jgi:hypothetical protein
MLNGEWSSDGAHGGYTFRVGDFFQGKIRQRGGNGIYAKCWIITFNGQHVQEISDDQLYAQAWVEKLFVAEVEKLLPTYQRLVTRVPPWECFEDIDATSKWHNWKHDNVPRWSLTASKDHLHATEPPRAKKGEA